MIPSNFLNQLIQSMTKSEKRYFHMNMNLHKRNTNYQKLFTYLGTLREYDEDKVLTHFKGRKFIVNFSSIKYSLYQNILRSLSTTYHNKNERIRQRNQLNYVEVLFEKGLYQQAEKLLKRLNKDAETHEEFLLQMQIISWEQLLLQGKTGNKTAIARAETLAGQSDLLYQRIHNEQEFRVLYLRMFYYFFYEGFLGFQHHSLHREVSRIIRHPLLRDEKNALSKEARLMFCFIQYAYTYFTEQFQTSYTWIQKCYRLIRDNPQVFSAATERHIDILYRYTFSCITTGRYKQAVALINDLKKIAEQGPSHLKGLIFSCVTIADTELLLRKKQYSRMLAMEQAIEQGMEKYAHRIMPLRHVLISVNMAIASFATGAFKNTAQWLNRYMNAPQGGFGETYLCFLI